MYTVARRGVNLSSTLRTPTLQTDCTYEGRLARWGALLQSRFIDAGGPDSPSAAADTSSTVTERIIESVSRRLSSRSFLSYFGCKNALRALSLR